MNVMLMRSEIAKAYSSDSWRKKVKAMSDNQCVAIYRRFQREGTIK